MRTPSSAGFDLWEAVDGLRETFTPRGSGYMRSGQMRSGQMGRMGRGDVRTAILVALAEEPMHGYQIALEIERRGRGFFHFNYGTLYPILHKLEKDGLVKGVWSPGERRSAGGAAEARRKRKSYTLTPKGRRYARDQRSSWRDFIANFLHVLDEAET